MNFIQPSPKINYLDLREKLLSLMREHNYAFNSINTYRKIFDLLDLFLAERGITDYDPVVGQLFLASCNKYRGKTVDGKRVYTDTVLSFVKVLDNIVLFGKLKPPKRDKVFYCPECYKSVLEGYLKFLKDKNYQPSTIENHHRYVSEFLVTVSDTADLFDDIAASTIYLISKDYAAKGNALYCISSFLRFAYKNNLTKTDYSKVIQFPKMEQKLPTVYSKDEIIQTLKCIDRTTIKGKRDYAMILLAYRLGLRVSDITSLRFENIDFENKKINVIQTKTRVPLSLPLLPEVKNSIEEYIAVRPVSSYSEVFLRSRAPFVPMKRASEYSQLKKYLRKASVNTFGKKRGLHALRSTLATELISENVSYAVTQKILGHTDSSAIQHYVKLDTETLRNFSISVPAPSGDFKKELRLTEVKVNE